MKYTDMKTTITATEFKTNLGKYLDSAIDGQEVIITKNGKMLQSFCPKMKQSARNQCI